MTITTTETYEILDATGTQDPYHFKFQAINNETIKVIVVKNGINNKVLVYNQDYVVELNSFAKSGYIRFLKDHPENGDKIIIKRETPLTQEVTFPHNVSFNIQNIELMGDKIMLKVQEVANETKRSLKFPMNVEESELPYPEPGKSLVWNNNGTKLVNSIISADGSYKSPVPNPSDGNPGDLLRINKNKSDYELFNSPIKEPKSGQALQILRVSQDRNSYEFDDLPVFPTNSESNIGKIPMLSSKNEFQYVKIDEKKLIATLEFERSLTYGESTPNDLVLSSAILQRDRRTIHYVYQGTRYQLNFLKDDLNLNIQGVQVFIYIKSKQSFIYSKGFTEFLVETRNLPEESENFQTKFEFNVTDSPNVRQSKTISGNTIEHLWLETAKFPMKLTVNAYIYE
jgi:hypothetical protein